VLPVNRLFAALSQSLPEAERFDDRVTAPRTKQRLWQQRAKKNRRRSPFAVVRCSFDLEEGLGFCISLLEAPEQY
jgi:hypothetical protein